MKLQSAVLESDSISELAGAYKYICEFTKKFAVTFATYVTAAPITSQDTLYQLAGDVVQISQSLDTVFLGELSYFGHFVFTKYNFWFGTTNLTISGTLTDLWRSRCHLLMRVGSMNKY